jgi:hypothetical protein
MEKVVIEGVIAWRRSESDRCICCDGQHICRRTFAVDGEPRVPWIDGPAGLDDVIYAEVTQRAPEGTRLRITIEEVPHA